MNVLDALRPALADFKQRFGARIESFHAARPNELYCHAQMELVPGFCAQLYKKWNGRVVSLFADGARAQDGVFYIYYIFALDSAGGFIILRVPVTSELPQFISLTNAVHAVNWQEREIQDLFGLTLIGRMSIRCGRILI